MDGVLVDSEPANNEQVAEFMESLKARPTDRFLDSLVGTSFEKASELCIDYLGLDMEAEDFSIQLDAYIQSHPFNYADYLNEGVKEILAYLRAKGYKTAVASSSMLSQIKKMANECQILDAFDVILSGEMFEESKPNPEIYLEAAKKLNVEPEQCLVIEDSSFGIQAGKDAGMTVLALKDTRYGINQSKADYKIESLQEIKKFA